MKEVLTKANDFVFQTEIKHAKGLYDYLKECERHAVVCGCPSCVKSVEGAKDAISREAWRVFDPDPIDHEELWIERNK